MELHNTKNRKFIPIAIAILLAVALSGWLTAKYYLFTDKKADNLLVELKDNATEGLEISMASGENIATVKIFYPSEEEMIVEERAIQSQPLPVLMAEEVITEYLQGLESGSFVSKGLSDTKILGVYMDKVGILYIDLSDEIRRNFSGDVRQEYYLLKSLFKTVITNIAAVNDVKLLVEGKEVESIGGHFYSLYPLKKIFNEQQWTNRYF